MTLDKKRFYLVHATPRDPFDEYLRDDKDAWTLRLKGIDADFVLVGHTHIPFCLQLEHTTVINPGSVGQPRDGDPRCSYAIIENGRVELRRIEYDIEATLSHMRQCGIDDDTLALAEAVLKTGGQMAPHLLERLSRSATPLTDFENLADASTAGHDESDVSDLDDLAADEFPTDEFLIPPELSDPASDIPHSRP